ncbi:MAG: hypothetical protein K2W79_01725, partial [Hydrotalea flava]|nr:hypothetical protein [Hydrotalea flava]
MATSQRHITNYKQSTHTAPNKSIQPYWETVSPPFLLHAHPISGHPEQEQPLLQLSTWLVHVPQPVSYPPLIFFCSFFVRILPKFSNFFICLKFCNYSVPKVAIKCKAYKTLLPFFIAV